MKITSAEFVTSGTKIAHFPTDGLPEVLFCGRSNVGITEMWILQKI